MKSTQQADTRLLNADIYRLLSICLDFPSEEKTAAIRGISSELSRTEYPDPEIPVLLSTLHAAIDEQEMLRDYSTIFITGGVPLNESNTLKKYNAVADVNAFYRAFGFNPKSGDNPDSAMYQLEFLALLSVKMAIAPNKEAEEITQKAYASFLSDHTADFAVALSRRIREGQAGAYFFAVSHLLEHFIQRELTSYQKKS